MRYTRDVQQSGGAGIYEGTNQIQRMVLARGLLAR
jgi:alkylation response protein AidB-like acyl-CoA dehydrogenase